MKLNNDLDDLESALWKASCQLKGLAEMLMYQRREATLDEENVWQGYGSLIREIGERLETWSKALDEQQVKKGTEPKRRSPNRRR